MDGMQIVSLVVAIGSVIGVVLAYFKVKPSERGTLETAVEQGRVNVAQGTLNVAQGTINLVTAELEDQFKRMAGQVRDMEVRMEEQQKATTVNRDDLQGRIERLDIELRKVRAEKAEVEHKNVILQLRVDHLEQEVAELKSGKKATEARVAIADERADRDDERAVRADERADRIDTRAHLAGERAGLSDARATRTEERAELTEERAAAAEERTKRDEARRIEENGDAQ